MNFVKKKTVSFNFVKFKFVSFQCGSLTSLAFPSKKFRDRGEVCSLNRRACNSKLVVWLSPQKKSSSSYFSLFRKRTYLPGIPRKMQVLANLQKISTSKNFTISRNFGARFLLKGSKTTMRNFKKGIRQILSSKKRESRKLKLSN